jgi:hypothetical protein
MAYTSITQPLCRYCAKRIPKHTLYVSVHSQERIDPAGRYVVGPLYCKADCQRRSNSRVVHVSYWNADPDGRRRVSNFSTWDGVSYRDEFFCSGPCRDGFAYAAARHGGENPTLAMPAWREAISERAKLSDTERDNVT